MSPKSSNKPPMRQSCDGCHRQKLRCTREGDSTTEACKRCRRKQLQCVYSLSLPKGRPSIYRSMDEPTSSGRPEPPRRSFTAPVNPLSRSGGAINVATTESSSASGTSSSDNKGGVDADVDTDGTSDSKSSANHNVHPILGHDSSSIMGMGSATDLSAGSWLASLDFDGDNIMDWDDQGSNLPAPNWNWLMHPESHTTGSSSTGDMPDLFGLMNPGEDFLDGDLRGGSPSSRSGGALASTDLSDDSGDSKHDINGSMGGWGQMPVPADGPEQEISRLSQLSMRLSSLRRSCCALAEVLDPTDVAGIVTPHPPSQILDDRTFESVTMWLAHATRGSSHPGASFSPDLGCPTSGSSDPTTKGGTLHELFSASNHLLEILRSMRLSGSNVAPALSIPTGTFGMSPTPMTTSNTSAPTSTPMSQTPSQNGLSFPQSSLLNISAVPSSQTSNRSIVHHLIIACHILLLDTYGVVLSALQHEAHHYHSVSYMETAALSQIRLVSVVQLCSYLLRRQHQAVDDHLSFQKGPPQNGPTSSSGPHDGRVVPSPEDEGAMMNLTNDVYQRLSRLQQMLYL